MAVLVATTDLPYPPSEVFGYHERPGALPRLTPPSFGRIEREPSHGLSVGSRSVLRIGIPGARLPGLGPAGLRWVARHTSYEPGRAFADVMESGPLASWRHEREFLPEAPEDGPEGRSGRTPEGGVATRLVERVTYELPRVARVRGAGRLVHEEVHARLCRFFAYRGRTLRDDLAFHASLPGRPRTIAIAGASGLVGRQLAALLGVGGHEVRRLVRGDADAGRGEISWDPDEGRVDAEALADLDVVVNLAGHPIAGRFTEAHLRRVRDSRVRGTRALARALADLASDGRSRALINASASGYYGPDRGDEELTEAAASGTGKLARIVRDWEAATGPARAAGVRVALLRSGIVQSPAGGQLGLQLPVFTWGLGGPLGSGRAWLPWIGIDDIAGAYAFLALTDAEGPFNACAPEIVRGEDYAAGLARVLGRPAALRVPRQAPELLLGRSGAREFALAGQRMLPSRLVAAGYRFRWPALTGCLEHLLATTEDGPTRTR